VIALTNPPAAKDRAGTERIGDRVSLSASRVLLSGDSASSRAPLGFRPSPTRDRVGASSAFPMRLWTNTSDTLISRKPHLSVCLRREPLPPASRQRDEFSRFRVPVIDVVRPRRLPVVAHGSCDFMVTFAAMNPRPPATSARLSHRASAPAPSFRSPAFGLRRARQKEPRSFLRSRVPILRSRRGKPQCPRNGGASLIDNCLVHPIREHDLRTAKPRWSSRVLSFFDPCGPRRRFPLAPLGRRAWGEG